MRSPLPDRAQGAATATTLLVLAILGVGWSPGAVARGPVDGAASGSVPGGVDAQAVLRRQQEIARCDPGELRTWGDGQDRQAWAQPLRFRYEPQGAPADLPAGQVLAMVRRALQGWAPCGLQTQAELAAAAPAGPATAPPPAAQAGPAARSPDAAMRVVWSEPLAAGNVALARPAQGVLALSPQVVALVAQRQNRAVLEQTLQMVLSHEIGHFLGLMDHSRRCVDVMSYYTNARGEACFARDAATASRWPGDYRASLPTACDIARCRIVNRTAPQFRP